MYYYSEHSIRQSHLAFYLVGTESFTDVLLQRFNANVHNVYLYKFVSLFSFDFVVMLLKNYVVQQRKTFLF